MKNLSNSPNLKSVFANIAETRERRSSYDVFLNDSLKVVDEVKSSNIQSWGDSKQLLSVFEDWLGEYETIVHDSKFKNYLLRLRDLEIAILMYRSLALPTVSIGEMKLNRGNSEKSYAFSRAPFYAPDNIKNEIRVYMGSMAEYTKTIDQLKMDSEFLKRCEIELKKAMMQKLKEQMQFLKRKTV